jgi:hypothetical protein
MNEDNDENVLIFATSASSLPRSMELKNKLLFYLYEPKFTILNVIMPDRNNVVGCVGYDAWSAFSYL